MITRISKRRRNRQGKEVWKFVSAAVAITSIFIIYPIVYSLVLSMYRTRGLSSRFVGLGNIQRMFGDAVFLKALGNNLIYLVFQVPLMLVLGLFLAVLVNSPKLKFRTFFRLALFLPCVISLVAYSILFKMMFQTDGLINNFLMAIYVISKPINWLNDPFWAKVTIIIALCWRWTGYNMMFFLSGLQTISGNTLEAAEIDGANGLKKFFLVIVPQLKPIILFTTIMSTIGTVQLFDEVVNLTGGGPSNATLTASQLIYNQSFVYTSDFGYAATLSWALVIIIGLLSLLQFKVAGDNS